MSRVRYVPRIDVAFGLLLISTICFQKFALPSGEYLGVPVFVMWGVLLWLFTRGVAVIDPLRMALFGLMLCAVIVSLIIQRQLPSPNALILFLLMYSALVFRVDVDRPTLLRCLNKYQTAITMIALIVIVQQMIQFSIGSSYWPNIEKMVPKGLLVPGYMYIRPYDWDSAFLTPNGFFFLEPSGTSLYLALGVATEIIWFNRIFRLAIIGLGLLACMAGTGIVLLMLLSPFLLYKMDRQVRYLIAGVGVPLILVAALFGAFSHLSDRSGELSETNSSGHGRLVAPFENTIMLASDPTYILSGNGPGTSSKAGDLTRSDEAEVQWPSNKLIFEYGLITAILFHIYMCVVAFRSSPSALLAAVIFIPQMFFGGGIVTPTNVVALILFGSLLRLKDDVSHPVRLTSPRLMVLETRS